jgi:hypothetical protein
MLRVEPLERRDAPAALVDQNKMQYQDIDGDTVTATFSKSILANETVANAVFTFSSGAIAVNGSTATPEQLQKIDLTALAVLADATGTAITVSAVRNKTTGGDGFAASNMLRSLQA